MTRVFFPGCKVKAKYPEASERLAKVVIERGYADEVAGCCRVNHQKLREQDTAVCICNNCMAMIDEDAESGELLNIWKLIDDDPSFPLPSYGGKQMALQDCGRAYDRTDVQDAIRSLLHKMDIEVVELDDARGKSTFCGPAACKAIPAQDAGFAPWRYTVDAPKRGMFVPHDDDEIARLMKEHCRDIPTDEVVCYCTACDTGLEMGGKKPVNILELVFPS